MQKMGINKVFSKNIMIGYLVHTIYYKSNELGSKINCSTFQIAFSWLVTTVI